MNLVKIVFFVLVSFSHEVLSRWLPFNTTIIPVMKDVNTSLHKVSWRFRKPIWDGELYYLIDLDAPFTWKTCVVRHYFKIACGLEEGCRFPLSCEDTLCKEAHSYSTNPICPSLNITAKYGCNICAVTPLNPVSNTCKISQLTTDLVDFYVTNGRNPYEGAYPGYGIPYVLSCAPSSLLRSFPKNVRGVAAFSWSGLAFPRQLSFPTVADKFAVCLPSSSSAPGVIFLGDGPFYFTHFPNLDLQTLLSYTPMIRKSSKSLGYYIKINRISIKGTPIQLPSLKSESVKLSTLMPYTTLRSDIYKALVLSFSKATKTMPRVNAVKPFSLCLKASAIGSVRTGFRVPNIDLETESGKVWTISGDNSMKQTGNDAACLAFIDGGLGVKDAIVIGTFQIENNFLFLDLANQKLGFSSSLLARGTSCISFNFTEKSLLPSVH
ncbi:hypothetical protein L1987_27483 [Smallanthus sonchifolius]|uniref:Uncharacterized protein n=1 Tax=Smallanthus sonchifolius TaxID=185202 RepID=A0ACB9ID01_9ASTR|nr:hypothetical protein L1987_27483 [Smallanthus sonchifolius]